MIDALNDGLAAPGDGDGSLGAVGQHLTGHLDTGSRHLADLLDLAATLPYEAAALAGRHDKSEGDGRARHRPGGDQIVEVLTQQLPFTLATKLCSLPRRICCISV